jgi:hypothetical protein
VTLPSVKTTYTEKRSPGGKHVQEARSPGETEEPPIGVPVGVPAADRQASLCDIANYDRFSDKNWVTFLLPSGS